MMHKSEVLELDHYHRHQQQDTQQSEAEYRVETSNGHSTDTGICFPSVFAIIAVS